MRFEPEFFDYDLSPYTGITRGVWILAAEYLLDGAFRSLGSYDSPIIVPRHETEITYPHKDAPENRRKMEEMAEKFEGLARTLFVAAPLIHNDPETEICGYKLKEYYKYQILKACTWGDENYVGGYMDMQELTGDTDTPHTFQQTVEMGALVIGLDICRNEIWNEYTWEEKDVIAAFVSEYASAYTVPQNWRFFNMLGLAFLHKEGYLIDKNVMREHAVSVLDYYAGDGWYRDGQSFDYYSAWAFNVYAPIWNKWYGYDNEPYIAERFEKNSNELMKNYPDFFDRDGFTNMWGRSSVYRNASTAPFSENFLLKEHAADAGLARRIASGSLRQFFDRDDFLVEGVPSMGFYGTFSPLIQGYSCAESAYWLGKAFLCLALPEDHPFWTEKENNGSWEDMSPNEIKETVLDGPALCFTNHNANGETVLRTGKVIKRPDDENGIWCYAKLCYNSKYPWEAHSESMQYTLSEGDGEAAEKCNAVLWYGCKDGILYRRAFFNYSLEHETHWSHSLDLADFPVRYGIMRADKLRLYKAPVKITLGSYGFPDNGTEVQRKKSGDAKAIILKGTDHTGQEKQLAMTIYDGWDEIEPVYSKGTNPDSEDSIILCATTERSKLYGYDRFILISQVLTKESHDDFLDDELFPISDVIYSDKDAQGGYGDVVIALKDGTEKIISYDGFEGGLSM